MPKPKGGNGKGKVAPDDAIGKGVGTRGEPDTIASESTRRLPREPIGTPIKRAFWARERRKGSGKTGGAVPGLIEVMVDQLPMLTDAALENSLWLYPANFASEEMSERRTRKLKQNTELWAWTIPC